MPSKRRNPKFEWQSAFIASGLTGNTGFIGLLMSTFDNGDGNGFFITEKRITEMTGLSERSVRDHIGKLRSTGWVERVRTGRRVGGASWASTYQLRNPAETRTAQPEDSTFQPATSGDQPAATFRHLDHVSVNHSGVDQRINPASDDQAEQHIPDSDETAVETYPTLPADLRPFDPVSVAYWERLSPQDQMAFVEDTFDSEVMRYSPSAQQPTKARPHIPLPEDENLGSDGTPVQGESRSYVPYWKR